MKFKRIVIDNFGSLGEGNILELNDQGITFIQGFNMLTGGSNGSGKSTIPHALIWVLTGKTGEGISADNVINRYTEHKKNCVVKLYIDDYEIIRARKHKKYKDGLIIKKNNEDITLGSTRETTKFLEQIFCITYETLINSIILGASVDCNFLSAGNNNDRRKIFENILGIDKYPKYCEYLRKEKRVFSDQLTELTIQISTKKDSIDAYNQQKLKSKQQCDEFEQSRLVAIKNFKEQLDELQKINVDEALNYITQYNQVEDYNKNIEIQKNKLKIEKQQILQDLELKQNQFQMQISICEKNEEELKKLMLIDYDPIILAWKKIQKCQETNIQLKNSLDIIKNKSNDLIQRMKPFEEKIAEQEKFLGKPCPTCGTTLDQKTLQTTVATFQKEISDLKLQQQYCDNEKFDINQKIEKINDMINSLIPSITENQICINKQKIDELTEKISKLNELKIEFEKINEQIQNIKNEFDIKEKAIPILKINTISLPRYSENELYKIKSNMDIVNNNIKHEQAKENPYLNITFDKEIKKLTLEINSFETQINEIKEKVAYYEFWINAFGNEGLKAILIKDLLPYFNVRIEYYLNLLYNGLIRLKFDEFLNYEMEGADYNSFSKGEKRRLDVAVMFALFDLLNLRNQSSSNILILDEVLDNLDVVGVEAIKVILEDLNKRISSIFCISHNPLLSQYFTNVITVTKEKNKIAHIEKE